MVEVHGFCDDRFAPLGALFRAGLERGSDEGAALAVSMNGHFVVDLWGGFRDLAQTEPWETDTLVQVASTSKVIVAIATLMAWDRGLLDLDDPIATYWPEFAQNGKAAVTTRQVLVHRAGLPGFGRAITLDEIRDWDRMVAVVEGAPLWYEPGTITGYQHVTFGYVLGELVHRVSGRPFAQFVSEEITEPLGADFSFALSAPGEVARVAEIRRPPETPEELTPMAARVMAELAAVAEPVVYGTDAHTVVIPGASGVTNARAVAGVGSIMALGGDVGGRRYLSRPAIDEVLREQSNDEDRILGVPVRRGLFFALHSAEFPAPTPTTIHWGGHGGSWVTMDPASGISCAYTPNRWLVGDAWLRRQGRQWQTLTEVLSSLV